MYTWRNARRNTWQKCNNVSVNNVQVKLVGCLKYVHNVNCQHQQRHTDIQ